MSQKRDYYDVLGVARDASEDDIRKAWRQAALKHHPDRNQGDAEAEARFKEAHEAFQVLSDGDKRRNYDRFGHAGVDGMGAGSADIGDILSQFQDMFSDFFGGFGGFGGASRRRGPQPGQDVRTDATISLADTMTGTKREVSVRGVAPCETCAGSGSEPGHAAETCTSCQGSGQVTTQRGFMLFTTNCPTCGGAGRRITHPCAACHGAGRVEKSRVVLVTFPAGIDSGQRLRVPGQGMAGAPGAPSGDLYVDVQVGRDETFERRGYDLVARERVSFADAALGCELEIELPDASSVTVEVKSGTQPGTVLTVKGRGIPRLDHRGRGDVHVVVEVAVPKRLSKRARKLIEELDAELNRSGERSAKTG
ncbi:MAG: molecular chaperone DnaJ [Polyangiaceae bacterium]|nr:molecular chaperone DnaJ [Polyangiaceae bacterium]